MQTHDIYHQNNLLEYHGSVGAIYKVWIKNLLLTIVTLTIYRAWAKTRMRKYIWSHYTIAGDNLHYTGTGREIFKGYVKVTILFILISAVPIILGVALSDESIKNSSGAVNFLFIYLFFFARYSSLRYRLSRTTWRGIRGRLTGDSHGYVRLSLIRLLLNIITLGFVIPKSDIKKHSVIMNNVYLGNQRASFIEDASGLTKTHIITWLLAVPTLTISRFWYRAALANKKLENLSFGNIRFHGTYTGGAYTTLIVGNILLFIFTLGLAMPVIIHRIMTFHAVHFHVLGSLDDMSIFQAESHSNAIGEGLSDQFDTGMDIDFGFI